MKIFFSSLQKSFFTEDFHGTRYIGIPDPDWSAPEHEVKNPAWEEGSKDIPETITVSDESAVRPTVQVLNPACLLPPEIELIEVSRTDYDRIYSVLCTTDSVLSSDKDGNPITVPAPGPTQEQILSSALSTRDRLLALAAIRIAPLQDAADLGEATDADTASLKLWKQYRVAVNRVPDQPDFPNTITWPTQPSE